MELTYTIRAEDGKEYGPATLDQITAWAREGRVNQQTEIRRSDMEHWAAAASFAELQGVFSPAATMAPPPAISPNQTRVDVNPQVYAQLKSGASWFYWIAGLSLINSIAATAGSEWRFIIGLGVTQILDGLGAHFGGAAKFVTLGLDLVVAGIFIGFGVFAHKRHLWAFIAGMAVFAIDTLLMLMVMDWISLAFHAFVLFCLFRGLQACRSLNAA